MPLVGQRPPMPQTDHWNSASRSSTPRTRCTQGCESRRHSRDESRRLRSLVAGRARGKVVVGERLDLSRSWTEVDHDAAPRVTHGDPFL